MEEKYNLKIGFAGITTEDTDKRFKSFIQKNKELFTEVSYKNHYAIMEDGTEVFCIYRGLKPNKKLDQLILSSEDTPLIKLTLLDFLFELTEQIPEDFIMQYDETN